MPRRRALLRLATAAAVAALHLAGAPPASAEPLTLTQLGTPFNRMVGIDYHEPTGKVVASVNYPSGTPHVFELIDRDGSRTRHSDVQGLTDELKIATVRSGPCQGGFAVGETFSGNGTPGEIIRLSPDGSAVQDPWVRLPGETGLLRGGLFQDRWCAAGGDLVVVTTSGGVWRITSAGQPTRVAGVPAFLEGVTTLPHDPARYGPWAGKIVAGAEQQRRFYVVDPATGAVHSVDLGIRPEDLDVIPADENLFVVHYGANRLLGADAGQFAGMEGDLLVTEEYAALYRLHWTGSDWQREQLWSTTSGNLEHVTFAPAGVVEVPPVNRAPVADAGDDQFVEQTSPDGAVVALNGTRSTDPDGDPLTWSWTGPGGLSASGPTPSLLLPAGTTTLALRVQDDKGAVDHDEVVVTVVDRTAPTIAGAASPPPGPGGWNDEPVVVTFTCADDVAIASCTGPTTLGEGADQSVPGTAVDTSGLTASTVVGPVSVDLTAPVVALTGGGTYDVDQRVQVTCSASDALSGIATQDCPALDAAAASLGTGSRTLTGTATDVAGNTGSASVVVRVVATTDGTCRLVRQLVAHEGVANSLCSKLRAAAASAARGDGRAHDNQLEAFRREVAAQRGKAVPLEAADTLTEVSRSL